MKYNFSILKNKTVGFHIIINSKQIDLINIVKNVKQTSTDIIFLFDNCSLSININVFLHMLIREHNDIVWFIEDSSNSYLSSFIGFTMFDTYGFPIELTNEIFNEKNEKLDIEGYYILRTLQKELSKNTFKNKNAF